MPKRTRITVPAIFIACALMLGLLNGLTPASASTQEWVKEIDMSRVNLRTSPDKTITAVNCSQDAQHSFAIKSWSATGSVLGTFPVLASGKRWGNPCSGGVEQTGPDGILYIPYYDYSNGYVDFPSSLKAVKGGVTKWTYTPAKNCAGHGVEVADIVVNTANVYVLLISSCSASNYVHELVKISPITGAQVFRKNIGVYQVQNPHYALAAHQSGLVVRLGSRPSYTFKYFDFNGVEATAKRYVLNLQGNEIYAPMDGNDAQIRVSPDGTLTVAIGGNDSSIPCSESRDRVKKLIRRSLSGTVQTVNLAAECFAAESIRVLPNGTTIFLRTSMSDGDYDNPTRPILSVSTSGGITYPVVSLAIGSTNAVYGIRYFEVDGNGNIVLLRDVVQRGGEHDEYVSADVLASSGILKSRTTTPTNFNNGQQDVTRLGGYSMMAIANGSLYFVAAGKVTKLALPEIGMDYPRNTLLASAPPGTTQQNYVALGDSFSSGEGVEPFDPTTDQSGNKCHRSELSYAKLLDQDPTLNVSLQKFVACSGAVTQHIAGTGDFGQLPQVTAITSTTKIVTLTFGGNNIGFKEYLTACLTPFAGSCNMSSSSYTMPKNKAQQQLPGELNNAYAAVKTRLDQVAPTAKVYVVGYPYVIRPYPVGGSGFCPVELSQDEGEAAKALTDTLNSEVNDAVTRLNDSRFRFVSATTSTSPFGEHDMCSSEPYFNNVEAWLSSGDGAKKVYTAHPNAKGQQAYA